MTRFFCSLLLCAGAALVWAVPLHAQTFSETQRGEIEGIVKAYLIAHPEVIQEVMTEIEKRQADAEAEKHKEGVKQYSKVLFYSPRQVTLGNPNGDVTMVEFFDYNCGFCKRALSDMVALLHDDPRLKIVLKELPVLGPESIEAARVAVAVRMEDPSGKKYLSFHQQLLGGRGPVGKERALMAALDQGLNLAALERDMASDEVRATIAENIKLASAVGISGTPGYVIGNNLLLGAVGITALRARIAAARGQRMN